ncbi:MAG: HAD hydrolase-like protein [Bacteroidetes bacterium]|jgi:phosphonatase-like hydrolase|nr:HAD hydrolase-like protein [Bacteroidota bacterium]
MDFKLIVFDIAGTTLHDNEDAVASAFKQAIVRYHDSVNLSDIKWVMGYRKKEAIQMLLEHEHILTNDEEVESIHDTFLEILNSYYREQTIREIHGISELFKKLKQSGCLIALNTGFSRSTTDIILARLNWKKDDLIDSSVTSDEVENGRPETDMIAHLQDRHAIKSSKQIVKIGDTPSDLLEGKNAECGLVIGVLYGTHSREELEKYPHDYLAASVDELTQMLIPDDKQ